jgi:hypothetical protein
MVTASADVCLAFIRAGDQSGQHGPARLTEYIAGHRRQLHPGVLQDLVQALGLAGAFLDLRP